MHENMFDAYAYQPDAMSLPPKLLVNTVIHSINQNALINWGSQSFNLD